jgi:2-keto-4-pentenoate hydratase/2-oxohepta-3-ene-1,7-dioic acid hydratase in catechol pathway
VTRPEIAIAPGKIVCVGRNYRAHAHELSHEVPEEPLLFLKPPSSVIGPGDPIVRPVHMSTLVHHEGELAIVVGTRLSHASAAEALAGIAGYTCGNDVTARDVQRKEGVFGRAKGFDTFCPLGPRVVPAADVRDPQALSLRVLVNGALRQAGNTADMVFPVGDLLSFISLVMTLVPGDVVLTGTPEGVGPLVAGDVVRVEIDGIGALENPVVDGAA